MGIRYSDVFPILAKSIPGVEADDEDWKEPTPYSFRIVGRNDSIWRVVGETTPGRDNDVRDLVPDGLDSLRENCESSEAVTCHFGPKVIELWRILCGRPTSAFPNAER